MSRISTIVLFVNEFPPGPGGIGNHAYHLSSRMAEHSRVDVITASRNDFPAEQFDAALSFSVSRYPANNWFSLRTLRVLLRFFLKAFSAQVVIFSGSTQLLFVLPLGLLARKKCLAIVHGHELHMAGPLKRRLINYALRLAGEVVAVSEFARKRAMAFGLSRTIRVIPNGVVSKVRLSKNRISGTEPLRLITVGTISRRKGQHYVVRAIPDIRKKFPLLEYHVIGMPVEIDHLRTEADRLGVNDSVKIHGVLSDADRDSLLATCDVFMMLSESLPNGDTEGFGIAALEANALGIPAIGSRNTGLEQAIRVGASGLLVDAPDTMEVAEAVSDIMANRDHYRASSIDWANQHDWSIIGSRYLELVQSMTCSEE